MKSLIIITMTVAVVIILGIFYFKDLDTTQISDILMPNRFPDKAFDKKPVDSHQPTYQDRLNSMGSEECKNVADNPLSYPPEVRKRCSQVFPSTSHSTFVTNDDVIEELEKTYLFTNRNFEDLYLRITDEMLTPEALENCANLWKDMVEKTTSVNKNNMDTISPALESQSKFSSSYCYMTQDKWYR